MSNSIKPIAIDKLVEHPANPNRMSKSNFAKLVSHIKRTGRYEPIVVRGHPLKEGYYQILNGCHRTKVLYKLGYENADCVVWDVDDNEAYVLLMTLNRLSGSDLADKKIALLKKLREQMPAKKLSKLLPQTAGQIEKLINLKLPDKPARLKADSFATAIVFFVNESQRQTIEYAINAATEKEAGLTRAQRKARALDKISKEFLSRQM